MRWVSASRTAPCLSSTTAGPLIASCWFHWRSFGARIVVVGFVFISYARRDRPYVEKLAVRFDQRRIEVWYDDEIESGARWLCDIDAKVRECAAFVPVVTPEASASEWCEGELELARSLQKVILPIRLRGDLPVGLRARQSVDGGRGRLPEDRWFGLVAATVLDVDDDGFLTEQGVRDYIVQSGRLNQGEEIVARLLLFKDPTQRTWLTATTSSLLCLLDDEETWAAGRVIQWKKATKSIRSIHAEIDSAYKSRGRINFGSDTTDYWYSWALHPNPAKLEASVGSMIKRGRPGRGEESGSHGPGPIGRPRA